MTKRTPTRWLSLGLIGVWLVSSRLPLHPARPWVEPVPRSMRQSVRGQRKTLHWRCASHAMSSRRPRKRCGRSAMTRRAERQKQRKSRRSVRRPKRAGRAANASSTTLHRPCEPWKRRSVVRSPSSPLHVVACVGGFGLLMLSCAHEPNPLEVQAKEKYASASQDPAIRQHAGVELARRSKRWIGCASRCAARMTKQRSSIGPTWRSNASRSPGCPPRQRSSKRRPGPWRRATTACACRRERWRQPTRRVAQLPRRLPSKRWKSRRTPASWTQPRPARCPRGGARQAARGYGDRAGSAAHPRCRALRGRSNRTPGRRHGRARSHRELSRGASGSRRHHRGAYGRRRRCAVQRRPLTAPRPSRGRPSDPARHRAAIASTPRVWARRGPSRPTTVRLVASRTAASRS